MLAKEGEEGRPDDCYAAEVREIFFDKEFWVAKAGWSKPAEEIVELKLEVRWEWVEKEEYRLEKEKAVGFEV